MFGALAGDVRYQAVDRKQISLVRTMMGSNGFVASILDCIRQTMHFSSMTMDPEETMSKEDVETQIRHYRKYIESAMLSDFALGFLYFGCAVAEPSPYIETPEPSTEDISSGVARPKKMLVPIMPDDSELVFRIRIKTQASPEVLLRSEIDGNPNEIVPRRVVAESSPDQPDAETGMLQSKCSSLLFDFLTMLQNQNFQTRANFSNCQPITVVHKVRKNLGDGVSSLSAAPIESRYLQPRYVKERLMVMEETTEAVRMAQHSITRDWGGNKDLTHYWNNPLAMARSQQPFKHHVEDGILVLPEDHQVGTQPLLAQAPNNMHDLEHRFVLSACARFGVPTSMIFYGSGRTTTIASTTERFRLIETAQSLKEKYEDFLGRVFAHLNGGKRCKFTIHLNTVHDPAVYEDCYRLGVMDLKTLADAYSKTLGMDLVPVDPSKIPITMPASKLNLYAAKESSEGRVPTIQKGIDDLVTEPTDSKKRRAVSRAE